MRREQENAKKEKVQAYLKKNQLELLEKENIVIDIKNFSDRLNTD